jgi:integrase
MERFFEHRAALRHTAMIGRNVLYGYLKLRSLTPVLDRIALSSPLEALRGWPRLIREDEREPLPEPALGLLFDWMAQHGRLDSAVCAVIQFDTYARPTENLMLLESDLCRPASAAGAQYANTWAVTFAPSGSGRTTKTGQQDDTVVVGGKVRPWVAQILQAWLRKVDAGERLFPRLTLPIFAADLAAASNAQHLRKLGLTPHALRHSGPSIDRFAKTRSAHEVKKRGRWLSDKSVARYEKHAKLLRQLQRMSLAQQRDGRLAFNLLPITLLDAIRHR